MFELVTGPLIMALGAVLVLMGVYGAAPWPWQRSAAGRTRGLNTVQRTAAATATSLSTLARGARKVAGRALAVEQAPVREPAAAAEDTIAALLSELLTLREEVDGLRAQIGESQKKPASRAKPAGRKLATARSA